MRIIPAAFACLKWICGSGEVAGGKVDLVSRSSNHYDHTTGKPMYSSAILSRLLAAILLLGFCTASAQGQEGESTKSRFEAADGKGTTAWKAGNTVYLEIGEDVTAATMPRLAAPLKSIGWADGPTGRSEVTLKPEQYEWIITWKNRQPGHSTIAAEFGASIKEIDQAKPVTESSDRSIFLPAHMATTAGEKVRYEPQPHKNTVGYWVGAKDTATWNFQIESPGSFNVSILQGCGKGQGGSSARIEIAALQNPESTAAIDFEVKETGHFQNFQWRHLGEITIAEPGVHRLVIKPNAIKKNALMDARAIHLVRLPAKR